MSGVRYEIGIIAEIIKDIFCEIVKSFKIFLKPQKYPLRKIKIGVVASDFGKTLDDVSVLGYFIEENLSDQGAKIILLIEKDVINLFKNKNINPSLLLEKFDFIFVGQLSPRIVKRPRNYRNSEYEIIQKDCECIEYSLNFKIYNMKKNCFVANGFVFERCWKPDSPITAFKSLAKQAVESIIIKREGKNKNEIIEIEVHTKFDDIIKSLTKSKI